MTQNKFVFACQTRGKNISLTGRVMRTEGTRAYCGIRTIIPTLPTKKIIIAVPKTLRILNYDLRASAFRKAHSPWKHQLYFLNIAMCREKSVVLSKLTGGRNWSSRNL